ncbi:hypothetical protein Droror1_Dr00019196 [Drosera rotundifolia]
MSSNFQVTLLVNGDCADFWVCSYHSIVRLVQLMADAEPCDGVQEVMNFWNRVFCILVESNVCLLGMVLTERIDIRLSSRICEQAQKYPVDAVQPISSVPCWMIALV